jgi:hypothetical protein
MIGLNCTHIPLRFNTAQIDSFLWLLVLFTTISVQYVSLPVCGPHTVDAAVKYQEFLFALHVFCSFSDFIIFFSRNRTTLLA